MNTSIKKYHQTSGTPEKLNFQVKQFYSKD